MKNKAIYVVSGVLAGVMLFAVNLFAASAQNTNEQPASPDIDVSNGYSTMMGTNLSNLSGDAFDRAFLEMMILHHEKAISMANMAANNARHQEVKDMAQNIINTQNREIEQMRMLQSQWGYPQTMMPQTTTPQNTRSTY